MSLVKMYCKELIHQIDQLPVYLPGSFVKPGDIIAFNPNFFGVQPIGTFSHINSLKGLGIAFQSTEDPEADTYKFASTGSVSMSFKPQANAGNGVKGSLDISFMKEGSTYLAAVDCKETFINDLMDLETRLMPFKNSIDWNNCFIVTSVTVAKKALIMQSSSNSASLSIQGDVKGLKIGNDAVDASLAVEINAYKDASFIKEWADNVQVFFKVAKFRRKFLGGRKLQGSKFLYDRSEDTPYTLESVNPHDILMDKETDVYA